MFAAAPEAAWGTTAYSWTGDTSASWSNPNNWDPVGVPQNGDSLRFHGGKNRSTINDLVGLDGVALTFLDDSFVISGNPLGIREIFLQSGGAVTINCQLILSETCTMNLNSDDLLHINGNIDLNGYNLYMYSAGWSERPTKIEIAGVISGTGDVHVDGGYEHATVEFQGNAENTFNGTLYLSSEDNGCLLNKEGGFLAHRIVVWNPHGFNDGEGTSVRLLRDSQIDWLAEVVIQPGATLSLNNHFNWFRNLEMQGGVLDSGTTGNIMIGDEFRVNATNEPAVIKGHCTITTTTASAFDPHPRLTINGPVYPALDMQATVFGLGGFSKSGNGTMALSVSNYFFGELVISNGIVEARNDHALGQDYITLGESIKGVWLKGGTLLLRNVAVSGRDLHVDQPVNASGNFGLSGAFITCIGDNVWSGGVILNTNLNLIGDINFSGAISGPGGLGFFGGGTSYLGGPNANTYTGLTLVRCPLLELYKTSGVKAYGGALEVGGGAGGPYEVRWLNSYQNLYANVTLFDNGILNLNNFNEDLGPITFNGGSIKTGTGELGLYGLVTVNESDHLASISGRVGLPPGNHEFRLAGDIFAAEGLTISAAIVGAGQLAKTGGGILALSGASTYTGLTTVSEGLLSVQNATALGAGDPGTIVADGATLQLLSPGAAPVPERISIRGQGVGFGLGALDVVGQAQLRNQFPSIYACLDLTTNATISVFGVTSKLVADGFISGFGPLTLIGGGTLVYTNSNANTYSGDTIIRAGTLELRKPNNTIAVPGRLVLGDGDTAGVARAYQTAGLPSGGTVVVNANSLLDLNGFNQSLSQLTLNDGGAAQTGAGMLQFSGGGVINIGTAAGTLRKGASITGKVQLPALDTLYCNVTQYGIGTLTTDPELAISAVISGTGNLVKNGGGALRLTGANTFDGTASVYSGEVDVLGGTLIAGSATALGGINGATYVANGASLALINNITIANEALILDSTNNAALDNRGGNNIWNGPIQLSRNSGINVAPDWALSCSGVISGSGSLTKWGAGTLYLTGSANNSYNGATAVNAGTLLLAKPNAVTAVPGSLVVGESNGGALAIARNLSGYQVFGNIIVNSQGLYDINGQQENTDYLGLNGNARVETGAGSLILKAGASVAVAPGLTTTATINGRIQMDTGPHVFTVASGAATPDVSDLVINAQLDQIPAGVGLEKASAGKMRLAANNTYTGTTTVSGGILQVDGSQPQSPVQIFGACLQGNGTVGQITFRGVANERLAPGGSPGILTCSNLNATTAKGGTVEIELNGPSPGTGYDQVNVRGTVNLTGLKLSGSLGFASAVGDQFTIINNDGSDAVTGTFNGLAQNGKVYIGGQLFQINYAGGTGNDVVLTRLVTPPPPVLTIEPVAANAVRLRWPTNDPPFRLIAATNLFAPDWTQTLPSPSVVGTNNIVTDAITEPFKVYRLINP